MQFNIGGDLQMIRLQRAQQDEMSRNQMHDPLRMTVFKCDKEDSGSASNKTPGSAHSNKSLMRDN